MAGQQATIRTVYVAAAVFAALLVIGTEALPILPIRCGSHWRIAKNAYDYGWGGQGTGACGVSTCPFPPGNGDGTSFFTDTCIYKDPVCRPLDDMEAFDATDQELIGFAIFTEKSFHTGHLVLTAACNCEGNSGIYPAACAALRAAEQYIKDTFKPDTAVDGAFWQKWIDTCIIAAGEALPGCYGR